MSSVESLQFFFYEMKLSFQNAANSKCERQTLDFSIAERIVRIHLAGNGLSTIIFPAIKHLQVYQINQPELEIFIWDEKSTGIPMPNPPWDGSQMNGNAKFVFPHPEMFQINISGNREFITIGNLSANQIIIWIRDVTNTMNHDYAAPLLHIFKKWVINYGLGIVHAGCVGNEQSAVLIVGKGGSGKSTTSILSALNGLYYLSDDYTLLKFDKKPIAYCLYNTGKLHSAQLTRFPQLAKLAINPNPQLNEKPIIYMQQHFPGQIAKKRNLEAIIAPVVTGKSESRLVQLSALDTLKSLALSTLLQLGSEDKLFLKKMAGVAKNLPGYRLELGTDTSQITPLITQLLNSY